MRGGGVEAGFGFFPFHFFRLGGVRRGVPLSIVAFSTDKNASPPSFPFKRVRESGVDMGGGGVFPASRQGKSTSPSLSVPFLGARCSISDEGGANCSGSSPSSNFVLWVWKGRTVPRETWLIPRDLPRPRPFQVTPPSARDKWKWVRKGNIGGGGGGGGAPLVLKPTQSFQRVQKYLPPKWLSGGLSSPEGTWTLWVGMAMGQNPNRTPSEHPTPSTRIGSKMDGAQIPTKLGSTKTVLTTTAHWAGLIGALGARSRQPSPAPSTMSASRPLAFSRFFFFFFWGGGGVLIPLGG